MAKILIVEDDTNLVDTLRRHLEAEKHIVETAFDGTTALNLIRSFPFDLVILDIGLPELNGFEVCQAYRATGGVARILMLTGKSSLDEKEIGFDVGADDYLTKPFHAKELVMRVKALLRRPAGRQPIEVKIANLSLDPKSFQVSKDGVKVRLSPKEFVLLEFFMRHPNEVFNSDALLDRLWPSDGESTKDTVKTYVHRLREKLGASDNQSPQIVTVHAVGYMLKVSE